MKSVVIRSLAKLEGRRSVCLVPAGRETVLLCAKPSEPLAEE